MNLQHVHPGGYFTRIGRGDREPAIRDAAVAVGQLLVITRSDAAAEELGERLALAGMPVIVGIPEDGAAAVAAFVDDGVSTLVASHDYVLDHGPIEAPLVVHSRMATSSRQYSRRLSAAPSPVHVTFVVPEDEHTATSLVVQVSDEAVLDLDGTIVLRDVLSVDSEPASVSGGRRRFPLVR